MAYLNENNAFPGQNNLGWVFTFQPNGKYPVIDNRIFVSKEDALAYINDPTSSAIPGLILRVIEDNDIDNNGAYLVEKDEDMLKLSLLSTGNANWDDDIDLNVVDNVFINSQINNRPNVNALENSITIIVHVPGGVYRTIYMTGDYTNWSIDIDNITNFEEIENYPNWFKAVIEIPEEYRSNVSQYIGKCKILLSDRNGNIPSDWSTQWNSDSVTIENYAYMVENITQGAMIFTDDAINNVVYIVINKWNSIPIDNDIADEYEFSYNNMQLNSNNQILEII